MSKSKKSVAMLVIDPQNDFCDPNGSLFVKGADQDSIRLAEIITKYKKEIDDIYCTLDTHHLIHVAHPIFWMQQDGTHPNPFTLISENDILSGKFRTTNPAFQKRGLDYVQKLKANGRYMLCIWPPHCLIGSKGHNVVDPIYKAFMEWEDQFAMVDYITKGSNFWTEHYSAVQADVVDPQDPGTMLNKVGLIDPLENHDLILLTGQALDYCVANTIRDIANTFGIDSIKKMFLILDTTSCVNAPGLEHLGPDFLKEMKGRGMNTVMSKDIDSLF